MKPQDRQILQHLGRHSFKDDIIGAEQGLAPTMAKAALVAPSSTTALILGETGSGKEVIARYIHQHSARIKLPFIRVNCGAIAPDLIDSELFGHERGSFSGAELRRKGWFERADRGTLFLDEVGELSLAAQVRLLRVLQEGSLLRVGAEKEIQVDVRIVAATHRDLASMVQRGEFREDLWYRLNVFPIYLPPVRERIHDIPALAEHLARRASIKLGLPVVYASPVQLDLMARYSWPGNVREMQVVIERALILGHGKRLELEAALGSQNLVVNTAPGDDAAIPSAAARQQIAPLDDVIREHIITALHAANGRVEGKLGAAALLGLNPNTLRSKMRKHQIKLNKIVS